MIFGIVQRYLRRRIQEEIRRQLLTEPLIYGETTRVTVARTAVVNNALFNVVSGTVTVEEFAFFGHNVALLTGTHDYRLRDMARQKASPSSGRDIVIGRGVWISSNATVIGPCVIGRDAVVAAGAVVVGDVAAATIVGGIPAKTLKTID